MFFELLGASENDAGWADYLDKPKNGADVIPILKAG
jgi:hypothetical protein